MAMIARSRQPIKLAAGCEEEIVTNDMLNGELIRLDGAIRMAPKQRRALKAFGEPKRKPATATAGRALSSVAGVSADQNEYLAPTVKKRPTAPA